MMIETKPCMVCNQTSTLEIDTPSFVKWHSGMLVQNAFPDLSADERELLMTGTHPQCWERMWTGGAVVCKNRLPRAE